MYTCICTRALVPSKFHSYDASQTWQHNLNLSICAKHMKDRLELKERQEWPGYTSYTFLVAPHKLSVFLSVATVLTMTFFLVICKRKER